MESPKSPLSRPPIHTIRAGASKYHTEERNGSPNLKKGCCTYEEKGHPPREFGGSLGCLFLIFALPALLLYLNIVSVQKSPSITKFPTRIPTNWRSIFLDPTAWKMVVGWILGHALFASLPIGSLVLGRPLKDKTRLSYRCNGFLAFLISMAGFVGGTYMGYPVASVIYKKWLRLAATSLVISMVVSIVLYVRSFFISPSKYAPNGDSGSLFYDFFMGSELNPRLGSLDLKFFCELRPGLIGWAVLNLSAFIVTFEKSGNPNWAMAFICGAQLVYVGDALWSEASILSTMDIIHEGFGYMLVFGDLVWVPFIYSLQSRYIAMNPTMDLPWYCIAPLVILHDLESIPTGVSGRRLVCSGWWGLVRHPNYLGDILMAWSWCLACGFRHFLPFVYAVYLTILLVTRELRDERVSLRKYGSAWTDYCRKVPHRIFPKLW